MEEKQQSWNDLKAEVERLKAENKRFKKRLAPIDCRRPCCSGDPGGCAGCGCHQGEKDEDE